MVGITEIAAAFQSLKAAKDIFEAMQGMQASVDLNDAKLKLQKHISDAQSALFEAQAAQVALSQEVAELKKKLSSKENWEIEKQRYQIGAIDNGAFAVVHKQGMENGEPPMWLCQTCFEKCQKSPLQFRAQDVGKGNHVRGTHSRWGCNLCKAEVTVHYGRKPSKPWPEEQPAEESTSEATPITPAQPATVWKNVDRR